MKKILYFDCGMGAAGDMLTAALLDLIPDPAASIDRLNALGLPGVTWLLEDSVKCGISGKHVRVIINGEEEEAGDDHVHTHAATAAHEHVHEGAQYCEHEHDHDHEHHHEHDHDHEHDDHCHEHEHDHCHEHDHDHEHCHEHDHDHDHDHDHHHDHDHDHLHDHDHDHDHHHDHDHDHLHDHDHDHDHDHHHDHGHGHSHHHVHRSMADVEAIIRSLALPEETAEDVLAVYRLIAEAESHAHNRPVSEIHFHEVGTMDAIADVAAVCCLMREIAPDEVIVSPIHVGSGHVHCAHGILPVPAPATAFILQNAPIYGGRIRGELCTPTGAALLVHFATRFGDMPVMRTTAIGYGMGTKDFEIANCVRVMLGEPFETSSPEADTITELSCNLDDMTGEDIGYAMQLLLDNGARDVFTTPISMKKNRPGILLTVICDAQTEETMVRLLFRHTTTIGVRKTVCSRYLLSREMKTLSTPYGDVRLKEVSGHGVRRAKFEYNDLQRLASENNLTLAELREALLRNE